MTRNALLETIQKISPVKLELEYLAIYLDNAFTDALPAIYKLFPAVIDQYCKMYEVAVENSGKNYFCTLPDKIIQFPFPGSGVRSIDPLEDYEVKFVPSTFDAIKIHGNLEVDNIGDEIDYYVTAERVEFARTPGDNKVVRMRLMIPLSEKDEDDDIFLPPGAVNEIVKQVINFSMGAVPVKESNDQSGKQT